MMDDEALYDEDVNTIRLSVDDSHFFEEAPSSYTSWFKTRKGKIVTIAVIIVLILMIIGLIVGIIVLVMAGHKKNPDVNNNNDPPPSDPVKLAAWLLKTSPLIDGHNDVPWEYRVNANSSLDKPGWLFDQGVPQLMTDIPRLRKGGVGGQFWSVYTNCRSMYEGTAVQTTLEQIDFVHRLVQKYPKDLALATTSDEILQAFAQKKIPSLIGMEGGHSINNSLATLRMMYQLGARYMTLTHSCNTEWADCAQGPYVLGGLSVFGEYVVREMNRLGMLVDLSHVSDDTMKQALAIAEAPVIFSHSSVRSLCGHVRNVPDDVLDLLPANGGVVMINGYPNFVCESVRQEQLRLNSLDLSEDEIDRQMQEFQQNPENPLRCTLKDLVDHVDYIRRRIGAQFIGIGADFDGIDYTTGGFEDVSRYQDLVLELLNRNYSIAEIRGIMGGNLLRVMKQAETAAARLQSLHGPYVVDIHSAK